MDMILFMLTFADIGEPLALGLLKSLDFKIT